MKKSHFGNPSLKFAIALGAIAALGPSAVDMYLPSLPEMAVDYSTSVASIQLTLTVFLLAMGLGQLLFGPVVDALGRRRPLIAGLLLFSLSALAAGAAPTLEWLLLARFAQGIGSALTLVVIMSMVRDVTQGVQAAKLFGLLLTIQGVAPIIAPGLGGYIEAHFGWRAVMLVLAVLGALVAVNSMAVLPETLPMQKREPLNMRLAIRTYARIAKDGRFLRPALALSAVFFFLFAYVGGATFVYQKEYGLPAAQFGTLFGATGIAILIGAVVATRLVGEYGLARMATAGAFCIFAGSVMAYGAAVSGSSLYWLAAGVAVALLGLGIAETSLMTLVMSSQTTALGSTAALLGAFQLGISAFATPLTGWASSYGAIAWCAFLIVCAVMVGALTWVSVREGRAEHITALNH